MCNCPVQAAELFQDRIVAAAMFSIAACSRAGLPTAVTLPQPIFNVPFYPGQDAGFLGIRCDWIYDPAVPTVRIPELSLLGDVSSECLGHRRSLLDHVSREFDRLGSGPAPIRFEHQVSQAFDLLVGRKARDAFSLDQESPLVRDRYGRHSFGQSCLLARRLVEAGVWLVQLNWHREKDDEQPMWDCHHKLESNLRAIARCWASCDSCGMAI